MLAARRPERTRRPAGDGPRPGGRAGERGRTRERDLGRTPRLLDGQPQYGIRHSETVRQAADQRPGAVTAAIELAQLCVHSGGACGRREPPGHLEVMRIVLRGGEHGCRPGELPHAEQRDGLFPLQPVSVSAEQRRQGVSRIAGARKLLARRADDRAEQFRVLGSERDRALTAVGVARDRPEARVRQDVQVRPHPRDHVFQEVGARASVRGRVDASGVGDLLPGLVGDEDDRCQPVVLGGVGVEDPADRTGVGTSRLAHQHQDDGEARRMGNERGRRQVDAGRSRRESAGRVRDGRGARPPRARHLRRRVPRLPQR